MSDIDIFFYNILKIFYPEKIIFYNKDKFNYNIIKSNYSFFNQDLTQNYYKTKKAPVNLIDLKYEISLKNILYLKKLSKYFEYNSNNKLFIVLTPYNSIYFDELNKTKLKKLRKYY